MYGNYAGDVMNFDMAAEMLAMDDIEVRTVLTTDDVASAPRGQREKRRGVAGNFFIFKAAGAACDKMLSFDECERIARKANDHTYTMGVALAPCSLPQTLRPNFEIGADEMEIGMGIHGEPGVAARKAADRRSRWSTKCSTASSPRWRRRAATGWRCWSTRSARRR